MNKTLKEIAQIYHIDLDLMADDAARSEIYKDLVWDEIDRESQEGSNKS